MSDRTKLDRWCEATIEAGWLAALIVAPLFFNVFSSRVFEPDKISLIRTIALTMLLAWLVKLVNSGQFYLPAYAEDMAAPAETEDAETAPPSMLSRLWNTPFLLPILLLALAYLLSTVFSVARFVSWWGSYQRLQGTYTFVSYLVIGLLAIGHLRSPLQLRRLQYTIILTSLPIALYGVLQHYSRDPLPWGGDVTTRVAANAGNAIFLAAYLIMAFFFTLERIYSSFAYLLTSQEKRSQSHELAAAFAGGAYLFILAVQVLAIVWTQSRGPWLGLLLGLYVFVLLLFTSLRFRYYQWFTAGWIGLGVVGATVIVLLNTTTLLGFARGWPAVDRLSTILDVEGGTNRVRILIWEGASQMIVPHQPLTYPDGEKDAVNALRPLVGYGPEAMWVAYNPFYPPDLAHFEARNASPDRSHNETWDSLVVTGMLGFLAYMALFVAIFYWALRWLGLLINRRDTWLFAALLALSSLGMMLLFYFYDDRQWRFLGVSLPAGLMFGLGAYVTISAFLHPLLKPNRADLARQLLLVSLIASIVAHFVEIHFGIAIAATRTYFWVQMAMLLVVGMRWALPEDYSSTSELPVAAPVAADTQPAEAAQRRRRRRSQQPVSPARRRSASLPAVPSTVMADLLVFLTFVFIYTTNGQGLTSALSILTGSITTRTLGADLLSSPYILYLMLFTWLVAATVGLASEALQQRRAPGLGWWARGYALHAAIVWSAWLIYGVIQAQRLIPGIAGSDLDSQLANVAGHFALYTWVVVFWISLAGTVYAWPWLRDRHLLPAKRAALSLAAGVVVAVLIFVVISNVNIALVRADIIYKQGQQFDAQGNWLSSVELYRRALAARKTEDHYMLFLGRALLEQAKQAPTSGAPTSGAPTEGAFSLGDDPTISDVLALTPTDVGQMSRLELLRAAETVLQDAQRVNPLNTDHTANLARLYRTWADLMADDEAMRQEMLGKSLAVYDVAVTLSPNAAHLWNEKGNAHVARGETELAEAAYRHSLELDARFEQTYLLLADFYERAQQNDQSIAMLLQGLTELPNSTQILSYLGVAAARAGDLQRALDANLNVLELDPANLGAMRNTAILYRDMGDNEKALEWVNAGLSTARPDQTSDLSTFHQLAVELNSRLGRNDQLLPHYEQMRQLNPNDTGVLRNLANLYITGNELNKAVEVLKELAALEPNDYQHPLAIAQILQQVGQPQNALPFAQQAQTLAPDDQKPAIDPLIAALNSGS